MPTCQHADAPARQHVNTPTRNAQTRQCADPPTRQYADIPTHRCTITPTRNHANALACPLTHTSHTRAHASIQLRRASAPNVSVPVQRTIRWLCWHTPAATRPCTYVLRIPPRTGPGARFIIYSNIRSFSLFCIMYFCIVSTMSRGVYRTFPMGNLQTTLTWLSMRLIKIPKSGVFIFGAIQMSTI
jgi:hypothetical protein